MNTMKCKDCRHYDVIRSGKTRNPALGWCAVKSIYPMNEERGGPVFPAGVRRRESPDEPAKPEIVHGSNVVPHCSQAKAK